MKHYLGIHLGHETGVAVTDEHHKTVLVLEESKLGGIKTPHFYPFLSIMELVRLGYTDFERLCWGYYPSVSKEEHHYKYYRYMDNIARSLSTYLHKYISWKKTDYIKHHLAHAYSTFFPSGFDEAAVLIIDGSGEDESLTLYDADSARPEIFRKCLNQKTKDFSYGELYSLVTKYLGYTRGHHSEHCGKIMGLSSYGTEKYIHVLEEQLTDSKYLLKWLGGSSFEFLQFLEGKWGREKRLDEIFNEENIEIAAATQAVLEKYIIKTLYENKGLISNKKRLCMAGGVAMNSVLNNSILKTDLFDDLFVQPMSSDSGIALGAAIYSSLQNKKSDMEVTNGCKWNDAYLGWGAASNKSDVEMVLEQYDFPVEIIEHQTSEKAIARLLSQNKIVALYEGAMEVGARALGHRSILSAPSVEMRDKINASVKFREHWRPFAPVVLEDKMFQYFKSTRPEPFMSIVYDSWESAKERIAGVTHVDCTGRVQSVNSLQNEYLFNIINFFAEESGEYSLLNTSFNINGQPIVRTVYDAIITFLSSGIDFLVVNGVLMRKSQLLSKKNVSALDRKVASILSNNTRVGLGVIGSDKDIIKSIKALVKLPSVKYHRDLPFRKVICASEEVKEAVKPFLSGMAQKVEVAENVAVELGKTVNQILIPVGEESICESKTHALFSQEIKPIRHFNYLYSIAEPENVDSLMLIDSDGKNCLSLEFYLDVVCESRFNQIYVDGVKEIEGMYLSDVSLERVQDHFNKCIKTLSKSKPLIQKHFECLIERNELALVVKFKQELVEKAGQKLDQLFFSKILVILGEIDEAKKVLKNELDRTPKRIALLKKLALLEYKTKNYIVALEHLSILRTTLPLDLEVNSILFSVLNHLEMGVELEEQIQHVISNKPLLHFVFTRKSNCYEFMKCLIRIGKRDEFIDCMDLVLVNFSKEYFMIADLFRMSGNYEQAISQYEKIVSEGSYVFEAKRLKADSLAQIGRNLKEGKGLDAADACFEQSKHLYMELLREGRGNCMLLLNISDINKYQENYTMSLEYIERYRKYGGEDSVADLKYKEVIGLINLYE